MAVTLGFPDEHSLVKARWGIAPPRNLAPWLLAGVAGIVVLSVSLVWRIWTGDALRSIGVYFPLLSVLLTWRVWRGMRWESRGTWWGLLPLFFAALTARASGNTSLAFAFNPRLMIPLLPVGLTIFAYASGVVLLFGGARVWRRALFPLALLLFVNPVPKILTLVDLPLQYASADVARSVATALGVTLNGDQLKLMFAPEFGMFIAPGCNGIRGAVTLGYLALIGGYFYRFTPWWRALSVTLGITLGYIFNLLRLCVLVIYYWVALRFPALQAHGEGADYAIGAGLFLIAAALMGMLVRWKRREPEPAEKVHDSSAGIRNSLNRDNSFQLWKGVGLCAIVVLMVSPYFSRLRGFPGTAQGPPSLEGALPRQMGEFALLRNWVELDSQHQLTYRWGAYSVPGDPGKEIDVAYWLGEFVHYPMACHIYRGDRPTWDGASTFPTATGVPATFSVDFYQDAGSQTLEATTACGVGGCTQSVSMPSDSGIVFTSTGMKNFLLRPANKPVPVLIRLQVDNAGADPEAVRARMLVELRNFVSVLDTDQLARLTEAN